MANDADNVYFKRMISMVPAHMNRQEEEEEKGSEEEMEAEWEPEPPTKKKKKQKKSASEDQGDITNAREEKIQGKKESKQKKKKNKEKVGESKVKVQEAQEKLRARIAELQAKRGQSLTGAEAQERKRLERKQRKLNGRSKQKNKKKDAGSAEAVTNGGDLPSQQPVVVTRPAKPVRTKDGKLVFSKFDFTQSGDKERKSSLVGKDYKQILARLERREAKVAAVKETDAQAAMTLEHKFIWQDVMSKAKGEKVKDDKVKVKRSLQRKEKMKEKRKKSWGERKATEQTFLQKRQEKRQDNLQKRKDDKKAKHRKRLIKKGRILPGF